MRSRMYIKWFARQRQHVNARVRRSSAFASESFLAIFGFPLWTVGGRVSARALAHHIAAASLWVCVCVYVVSGQLLFAASPLTQPCRVYSLYIVLARGCCSSKVSIYFLQICGTHVRCTHSTYVVQHNVRARVVNDLRII